MTCELILFTYFVSYQKKKIISREDIDGFKTNAGHLVNKTLRYKFDARQEVWRFLTYMFIHSHVQHISFNVIIQICLGIPLELVHCWWRVTLVYLSGVLAGSIGQSYFKPCSNLVGASAGVYAVITAHVATIILNWHEMKYGAVQLFVFLVLCSCDIFSDVFQEVSNSASKIAHLSGAIAGILVGIGVLRNLRVRPYQMKLWLLAVVTYACLIVAGIAYNINFVINLPPHVHQTCESCKSYFGENISECL